MWKWGFFTSWSATERRARGREEETKSWAVAGCGGGGGGMMKEEAEDEEEKEEGERCVVLHCVLAAPAALPLCCLAHPASGRRPITAQESSATSVQCVRTNRGGRRYRDVRKTRGGRRGGKQIGEERDERRRRWKWEEAGGEKEGEADGAASAPPDRAAAACTISSELRVEAKHSCSCISVQGKNQREYLHADESQSPVSNKRENQSRISSFHSLCHLSFPRVALTNDAELKLLCPGDDVRASPRLAGLGAFTGFLRVLVCVGIKGDD